VLRQPVVDADDVSVRVEFQRGWFIDEAFGEGVRSGTQELQLSQRQRGPLHVHADVAEQEY
jgi:hypothetical protein